MQGPLPGEALPPHRIEGNAFLTSKLGGNVVHNRANYFSLGKRMVWACDSGLQTAHRRETHRRAACELPVPCSPFALLLFLSTLSLCSSHPAKQA